MLPGRVCARACVLTLSLVTKALAASCPET